MPTLEAVVEAHARRQRTLAQRTAAKVAELWRSVDRGNIAASWAQMIPGVMTVVSTAQATAAASGGIYTDDALEAQKLFAAAEGRVVSTALAGIASDGRALENLLFDPAVRTLIALRQGVALPRAMAGGLMSLDMITRTQVADAGRVAEGVAITARPTVTGYVRMLSRPSCSRCIILAGRTYKWNAGFRRHPRCDCRHVPSRENSAGDLRTDPKLTFQTMSPAEQDRVFTKAGAQALRDGADISQVVNARRGASGLAPAGARLTAEELKLLRGGERGRLGTVDVFGQQLAVTTEGTTTRGTAGVRLGANDTGTKKDGSRYRVAKPPRLMPESIYQIAGDDRALAIRLLKRNGYII